MIDFKFLIFMVYLENWVQAKFLAERDASLRFDRAANPELLTSHFRVKTFPGILDGEFPL